MIRVLPLALALAAFAAPLPADDARERRARVALALAAKPDAAQAPMPHDATCCYEKGHARALEQRLPLVVFVSCAVVDVEGAVVARTDSLAGVDAPAVVVAFPQGNRLLQDTVIPCPADKADVERAVRAAARKVDGPTGKGLPVAPKPLIWDF